jgi:hypothetical protein
VGTNGKCDHSNKDCCCGGHSSKDVKKNLNHNSTKLKLNYRKRSKFIRDILKNTKSW